MTDIDAIRARAQTFRNMQQGSSSSAIRFAGRSSAADVPTLLTVFDAAAAYVNAMTRGGSENPDNWQAEEDALIAAVRTLRGEATEPEYVIWSHHHDTWWGANGSRYRRHVTDAGRYALVDTAQWLTRGCGCCLVPEVVVPAPPTGMHGIALETWVSDQLSKATEKRIADGEVNRFAAVKAPNGCDECSVEPGEIHRYPDCPGSKHIQTVELDGVSR